MVCIVELVLPIDAEERRLFEAIDGKRTITEIQDNIPSRGGNERVSNFFEKLWWYNQVIFDASRHRGKSDDRTI